MTTLEGFQRVAAGRIAVAEAGKAFLDTALLADYDVDIEPAGRIGRRGRPAGANRRKITVGHQPVFFVFLELDVVTLEQSQQVFLECRAIHDDPQWGALALSTDGRSRQVRYTRRSNSSW